MTPRVARAARVSFVWCALLTWLWGLPVHAQSLDAPPERHVDVEVGGGFLFGASLGTRDAQLRANDTTPRPFALFTSESRLGSSAPLHARVGVPITPRLGVEGGVVISRPEVRTSLRGDVEGAPPITVVERIDQYFIEAGLVVVLEELRVGQLIPFAAVGAGYLRQLHEGRVVIEHGVVYHAGGGVKHWLLTRDRGFVRGAGLRADARLYFLTRGISFGAGLRPHGAVSGSAFVSF